MVRVEPAPPGGEVLLRAALKPLSQGRTDLAEQELTRIVVQYPDWEAPLRDKALLQLDTDRPNECLETLRMATRKFGPSPFWYRLASWMAASRGEEARVRRLERRASGLPHRATVSAYVATVQQAWQRARERGGSGSYAAWRLALLDLYQFQDQAAREKLAEAGDQPEAQVLGQYLALVQSLDVTGGGS